MGKNGLLANEKGLDKTMEVTTYYLLRMMVAIH